MQTSGSCGSENSDQARFCQRAGDHHAAVKHAEAYRRALGLFEAKGIVPSSR